MILKPERGNPVGRVGNKRSTPPNDRYYVGFARKFYKIREFYKIFAADLIKFLVFIKYFLII
jgi:hypothetical protein